MSSSRTKRGGAILGVLALGALAAFGAAAPASAVTSPGNIDPSIARSLTIHKYELSPTSPQQGGTGQEIPGGIAGGVPIEEVEFTATLLPTVDLLTAAGWSTASSLTAVSAAPLATGASFTEVTDAGGVASFTNMPLGLYLVEETASPDSVTDPTAPFLVTLPFPTGPTGSPSNEWIYDVHVYPKNSVTELVKTRVLPAPGSVESRNPDLVRWSIRAIIPTQAAGGTISEFTISDQIDPGLVFVPAPPTGVTPTGVTVTSASGAVQVFTAGTDYTVATAGNTQTLTFTPQGRTRLLTLGAGTVEFSVLTRAVSVPPGGQLTNVATSVVDGATESVSAVTPIGELTVFAYSPTAGGVQTPLAGAQYQVFLSEADARARTNPITVNGVNTWTTDATGYASIPALVPGVYWGNEIVPPTGYQIPSTGVVSVQVVAGPTSITAPIQNFIAVPHSQVPAWALPLTGGDGALWFGIGGGALIMVGIGAALVVARRRTARIRSAAHTQVTA